MKSIDLRSDTLTMPTPAMREAMYHAELGDDVFGEDPTVNRLEALAAEKLGKEAAVYVVSGTMGNVTAVLTHCGRGDGAILGHQAHIFNSEAANAAALGAVFMCALPNLPDGTIDPTLIEAAIPLDDIHHPVMKLVCLENTQNHCNGAPLNAGYMAAVAALAHRHGLKLHVDGARIFNAAVALGVPASRLVEHADSVMFCISKGLSAPVGSLLVGSAEFIQRARRTRKMLGGGMREAGVIAAAGIVALEQMVDRLQEDHDNAKLLAEGIAHISGLELDPARVRTNIIYFDVIHKHMNAFQYAEALKQEGVLMLAFSDRTIRAVTHYGIVRKDIEETLRVMKRAMAA